MSAEYPHRLTRERIAGCCGDGPSRGLLCQYHEGFNDGVEAMLTFQETVLDQMFTALEGES